MFWIGCFALSVAGMTACYSGDAQQNYRLTCSDVKIGSLETCREQSARAGFSASSTGSVVVPGYYCGSHDCDIHAVPGIEPPNR